MKTRILITLFTVFTGITHAQVKPVTETSEELTGNVKTVIEYAFYETGQAVNDTNQYSEKIVALFDVKGNKQQELHYNQSKVLSTSYTFQYLGDTIVIKNQIYQGKHAFTYRYRYDEHGKLTELTRQLTPAAMPNAGITKYTYQYNVYGNPIIINEFYNDSPNGKDSIVYNARHQKTKQYNSRGMLKKANSSTFSYDAKGNLTGVENRSDKGAFNWAYSYNYDNIDARGNWLLQQYQSRHSPFHGGVSNNTIIRSISYY